MIGYIEYLAPRYFAPRYFGAEYFRLPAPIDEDHRVYVLPALRSAIVLAVPRDADGVELNRLVEVEALVREAVVPAVTRLVTADDTLREVES